MFCVDWKRARHSLAQRSLVLAISLLPASAFAAVGATAGSFGVSQTGESQYSIRIFTPPGAGSMAPDLALTYSSDAGDGLAGVGFQISGLSQITRCNKTIAQDSVREAPRLELTDRFCLDGNRMRSTLGTYGAAGSQYRTELESFSRITAYSTAGNGPAYFIAELKNGLKYEYGNSTDSRVESIATGGGTVTTPRTWALNKIIDRFGNTIEFTYTEDATNGSFRPDEIRWATNASKGITTAPYTVKFVYEATPRPDTLYGYRFGTQATVNGRINETKRVDRIDVLYNTSTVVRRYDLTYESTGGAGASSRLQSLQECGVAGTDCYSSSTFSWIDGTISWNTEVSTGQSVPVQPMVMDINNDGRDDLVYSSTATAGSGLWYFMLASAGGGYGSPTSTGQTNYGFSQAMPLDWDGDGNEDFIAPNASSVWAVFRANGSGGFDSPVSTGVSSATSVGDQWWAADVNGDGRGDLIHAANASTSIDVFVRLNMVAGLQPESLLAQIYFGVGTITLKPNSFGVGTRARSSHRHPDFNGDGREDFVILVQAFGEPDPPNQPQIDNYLCEVKPGTPGAGCIYVASGSTQLPQTWFMGDATGDGLTDLFYVYNNTAYLAQSNGQWWNAPTTVSFTGYAAAAARAVDWDSDGRDDLIAPNGSGTLAVARSTGAVLSPLVSISLSSGTGNFAAIGDINGDGLQDLLRQNGSVWVYSLHQGVQPDLLDVATDGFGNFVNFEYTTLPQNNYTKGTSGLTIPSPPAATPVAFPNIDYQGARTIVSQFSASNGIGGSYTTSFWYHGATMNLQGRGFQGFHAVRKSDSRNGFHGYQFFRRDFPYTGMLFEERLYQSNNSTAIVKRSNTWASATLDATANNERLFPYLSTTSEFLNEFGGPLDGISVRQATTTFTFGDGFDYGNPTQIATTTTDSDSSPPFAGEQFIQTTTQHFDYSSASSNWCIGLPDQITVQSTLPGGATETRTRGLLGAGIDYTQCRVGTAYVEPADPKLAVTTVYGVDLCGNVSSVQVTGKNWDETPLTSRTTLIDYAANCVFPETVTNALGQQSHLTYRYDLGLLQTQADPNSLTSSFLYDALGRLSRVTRPDGTYTNVDLTTCNSGNSYCGSSDVLARFMAQATAFDSLGSTVRSDQVVNDGVGRERYTRTQVATGATATVASNYDSLGNLATRTAPYTCCTSYATTYTYDLLNRLINTSRPVPMLGGSQIFSFGYQGRKRLFTNFKGTTERISDVMGRLRRVIDPSPGGTTTYSYDPFGNLIAVTDPVGATQTWTFNRLGFKTQATLPVVDAGTWTFRMNSLGELVQQINAKSQTMAFTYDAISRPLTRTELEGTTRWIWDTALGKGIGQLASVTSPGYAENYAYDNKGRPQRVNYAEDENYQVDYAYNNQGLLDTLTYPVSNANYRLQVKYEYTNGHLTRTRDANGATIFWQLNAVDAFNLPIDETLGNGVQTLSSFDPATGWIESRQSGAGGSTSNRFNLTYLFDANGNFKQRVDVNQGSLTEIFSYDALNRLSGSTLGGSSNLSVSLDAAGNILSKTGVTGSYTYDTTYKRRLTGVGSDSYSYDSNGNMTSRAGAGITWFSYDLPSQINGGSVNSQFSYGPDRQRWKQTALFSDGVQTTIYVGGLMEKVRTPSNVGYHYYIQAGSHTVVYNRWCDGTTNTFYVLKDHLGSSSSVTCGPDVTGCASGNLFVQESFEAYGGRRGSNWQGAPAPADLTKFAQTTRHGYTGHEMLDNIGLIHMNGRVYDPLIGRFVSADPFVGDASSSQSFNRYAYVSNNPLSFTDPSGFQTKLQYLASLDDDEGALFMEQLRDQAQRAYIFARFIEETSGGLGMGGGGFGGGFGGGWSAGGGGCWSFACMGNQLLGGFRGVGGQVTLGSSHGLLGEGGGGGGKGAAQASISIDSGNVLPESAVSYELFPENEWDNPIDPVSISSGWGGGAADFLPGAGFAGCLFSMGTSGACGFGGWMAGAAGAIPAEVAAVMLARIAVAARGATTVIGKVADLKNLAAGEQSLLSRLPNLGSPKANWAQNSSILRQELSLGNPIRDASVDSAGRLMNNTGFLRAERNLLENRGWTYDPGATMWYPPVP